MISNLIKKNQANVMMMASEGQDLKREGFSSFTIKISHHMCHSTKFTLYVQLHKVYEKWMIPFTLTIETISCLCWKGISNENLNNKTKDWALVLNAVLVIDIKVLN